MAVSGGGKQVRGEIPWLSLKINKSLVDKLFVINGYDLGTRLVKKNPLYIKSVHKGLCEVSVVKHHMS